MKTWYITRDDTPSKQVVHADHYIYSPDTETYLFFEPENPIPVAEIKQAVVVLIMQGAAPRRGPLDNMVTT